MRRRAGGLVVGALWLAAVGASGMTGCGDDSGADDPDRASERGPNTVAITDRGYEPKTLRVPAGARVTWVNVGSKPNSVQTWHDIEHHFDIHTIRPGKRKSYLFKRPGRYEYFSAWGDADKYQGVVKVTAR